MGSLLGRCLGLIVWPRVSVLGTSSCRGWHAFMKRLAEAAIKVPPCFEGGLW